MQSLCSPCASPRPRVTRVLRWASRLFLIWGGGCRKKTPQGHGVPTHAHIPRIRHLSVRARNSLGRGVIGWRWSPDDTAKGTITIQCANPATATEHPCKNASVQLHGLDTTNPISTEHRDAPTHMSCELCHLQNLMLGNWPVAPPSTALPSSFVPTLVVP